MKVSTCVWASALLGVLLVGARGHAMPAPQVTDARLWAKRYLSDPGDAAKVIWGPGTLYAAAHRLKVRSRF